MKLAHLTGSFLPINAIILLRCIEDGFTFGVGLFGATVLVGLIFDFIIAGRMIGRSSGEYFSIDRYSPSEDGVLFYVLSIAPIFLSSSFISIFDTAIFFIIYIIVFIICFSSKHAYVNPVFYLFGVRYFEVSIRNHDRTKNAIVISTQKIMASAGKKRLSPIGNSNWFVALGG
jgi:hypothetical protein